MRAVLVLFFVIIPAAAQTPVAQLRNASRPASGNFQIGDRFEFVVTGAPKQPVSIRTTTHGRTDWSPIIGWTDSTGRWSTNGQFEKSDFGGWTEIWTVGGRLANPTFQFSMDAPCLPGGQSPSLISGPNMMLSCETTEGSQTFATPSLPDPFRTRDGRLVPGRPAEETPARYHTQILQYLISAGKEVPVDGISLQSSEGALGDETADLISNLIGVNALNEQETRNSLVLIRAAFAKPETIKPSAINPSRTLLFLRHLADLPNEDSLKREIADTIAYFQAR